MSLAILGGSGFLGSALVESLLNCGYDNIVLVSRSITASTTAPIDPETMSIFGGKCHLYSADLSDENQVKRFYDEIRPEQVINLAALVGGIGFNRDNPGKMFYDNIRIGIYCTHYAHLAKVQKYIYIGTVCSYPKYTPIPFKEQDIWNGFPESTNAPYGVVKKSIGVMMDAYREQYKFNTISLIPVNMYGPRDNFDVKSSHVIPALIRKMLEAKSTNDDVTIWGDGSATREFLYVYDCAEAIIMALKGCKSPGPINIGSGQEISIANLAIKIAKLTGFTGKLIWDKTKPNGQPRRCLDVSKAKTEFGFEAKTNFDDGLERTVSWYVNRK